ncbi:hypothetical protein CLU79DRAFT_829945 [Phycomyces nitens]|nr:hypothetical protein CLU79DRAFT_829945 [Phycomyces nitens]
MLASQLPFEILSKIANLLQPSEWRHCTLVCKSWHQSFHEVIWNDVSIETDSELNKLCDILPAENNVYQANGHLVRKLALDRNIQMTVNNLAAIRCQLPMLQSLSIEVSRNLVFRSSSVLLGNWPSLTQLYISPSRFALTDGVDELLRFLSFLPNLTRLVCTEFSPIRTRPFSFKNIETIHELLPRLEYLRIGSVFAPLSQEDIGSFESIVPANKLTKLHVGFLRLDLRWVCYYVHKYPNLRTFTLYNHGGLHRKYFYDEAQAMFSSLPHCFPHLETLNLTGLAPTEWSHIAVSDLIYRFNRSLKHLKAQLRTNSDDPNIQQAIKLCMRTFPETIVSLSIISEYNFTDFEAFPAALGACPYLQYLNIHAQNVSVELDRMLDSCPALKMLVLKQVKLSLSQEASNTPALHGLRLLCITNTMCYDYTLDPELLSYVSGRCRELRYMSLQDVKMGMLNYLSDTPNSIEMPYTKFKYLQLKNVHYETTMLCTNDQNSRMAVLIQNDVSLESGNFGIENPLLFVPSSLIPMAKTTWLNMYFKVPPSYRLDTIRVLTEAEAKDTKIKCNYDTPDFRYADSKDLVSLKFGSVERYDFCMDIDNEKSTTTWDAIHDKECALVDC